MANFDDFLKPESMVTPGIAGGITMVISNTLWVQFALERRWTGLVLSFALGAVVFLGNRLPAWQKWIYYGINSLIIFSVAAGSQYVGQKTSGQSDPPSVASIVASPRISSNLFLFTSPAHAQDTLTETLVGTNPYQSKPKGLTKEIKTLKRLQAARQVEPEAQPIIIGFNQADLKKSITEEEQESIRKQLEAERAELEAARTAYRVQQEAERAELEAARAAQMRQIEKEKQKKRGFFDGGF